MGRFFDHFYGLIDEVKEHCQPPEFVDRDELKPLLDRFSSTVYGQYVIEVGEQVLEAMHKKMQAINPNDDTFNHEKFVLCFRYSDPPESGSEAQPTSRMGFIGEKWDVPYVSLDFNDTIVMFFFSVSGPNNSGVYESSFIVNLKDEIVSVEVQREERVDYPLTDPSIVSKTIEVFERVWAVK